MTIQSIIRKPTSLDGSQFAGWTNEEALLQLDGSLAQSQLTSQNTNVPFLKLSAFDNQIPSDVTIVGVALRITGKSQETGNTGFFCSGAGAGGLQLQGVDGVSGRGMTAIKSAVLSTKIVGGDSDLWGATSIDVAQLNDATVYALFQNGLPKAQKLFLDCIEMEVFFVSNV